MRRKHTITPELVAGVDIPQPDLNMLGYIIWYGRRKGGRVEDVAKALWWENPYVRLSQPATMTTEDWTYLDDPDDA